MRKKISPYVRWSRQLNGETIEEPVTKIYTGMYRDHGLAVGSVVRFVRHPSSGVDFVLYPAGHEHELRTHPSGNLVDGNGCNGWDAAYVVVRWGYA